MANGVNGRQSVHDALTTRGERGVRTADFNYRKASLELGMLKGNAFVITLRWDSSPSPTLLLTKRTETFEWTHLTRWIEL